MDGVDGPRDTCPILFIYIHQIFDIREIDAADHRFAKIGEVLGIANASAHEQINQLVRKGYLKREAGKSRGLSVAREPVSQPVSLMSVPIIGKVAAGFPIFAEENVTGEILVDSTVASKGKFFALEVQGDSMVNADIRDGDILVVRQQPLSESGDVVVVLVGDEATVKRLYIGEDGIELRPENPSYQPIVVEPDEDLRIIGKVVAVRNLN